MSVWGVYPSVVGSPHELSLCAMRACYSKSLFIFLYFAGFTLSSVVDEIVEIVKYCHDRLIVAAPALDRISDFLN